jgi:hypothetical protein
MEKPADAGSLERVIELRREKRTLKNSREPESRGKLATIQ